MRILNGSKHLVLLTVFLLANGPTIALADIILQVSADTSSLASAPGPYALYFQLVNNGTNSTGGVENTIIIDQFGFGGGSAGPGAPTTYGGGSGNLVSPTRRVELVDSTFINSFSQQFQPGTVLNFTATMTANRGSQGPDAFSFSILGTNGLPIPTTSRVDELLRMDLDENRRALRVFRSDFTNTTHDVPQPNVNLVIVTNAPQFGLSVTGLLTNGNFQLDFPTARFADLFELEASVDLETWTNLGQRASIGEPVIFSDPNRTNFPIRFYRVRFLNP